MASRLHITTAITYSNGPPHVGHAYEYFTTDTYVRHQRRKLGAHNVTFVTGTDEHGQKNRDAAAAQGLAPKAFSDKIAALFRAAHAELNTSDHIFVRTTDDRHREFVQRMLTRTRDRGDIYFKEYEGLYCVGCERFYTEKELIDAKICPTHKRPVEAISEGNFFLRLEKYREQIHKHIEKNKDFIRPERYRNEALAMLAEPLDDLCISRPKSRLDWGIEIPFDSRYVTYVWYDAFWAYLSELPDTSDTALNAIIPCTEHFIGKDILKAHAVYWPAILLAAGFPLYRQLNVHGFLNFRGEKMAKSSGNIPDPLEYERTYGPDVLRYFLLRDVVYGLDGDFTDDKLIDRYNSDLANDLGNLTSRVLTMAARYIGCVVPAAPGLNNDEIDSVFCNKVGLSLRPVGELTDDLMFNRALEAIWSALDAGNKYVVATAPFTLAKDPANAARVARILANLLEGLRCIADALAPFMPATSQKVQDLLGVDAETARKPFGEGLKPGHRVKPAVALFPRIDRKAKA
jgi:methionyl-tRNA synthetase